MNNKKYDEYVGGLSEAEKIELMSYIDYGKTFNGTDEFTPVSKFLCKKYGLSVSAVFGAITSLSRSEGYSWASYQYIADLLGIDAKTVAKAADILLQEKLIFDVTEENIECIKSKYPYFSKQPFYKKIKFYMPNNMRLVQMKHQKQ